MLPGLQKSSLSFRWRRRRCESEESEGRKGGGLVARVRMIRGFRRTRGPAVERAVMRGGGTAVSMPEEQSLYRLGNQSLDDEESEETEVFVLPSRRRPSQRIAPETTRRRPSTKKRRKKKRPSLSDASTVDSETSATCPRQTREKNRSKPKKASSHQFPLQKDLSAKQEENAKPTNNKIVCLKCDGNHASEECPWFKKGRDKHPDAVPCDKKKMLGADHSKVPVIVTNARLIPQPPDGSCLFHSLAYTLGGTASTLRREIAQFIRQNPSLKISDTPLRDWIKWESLSSVSTYTSRMQYSGWGGGIEMAAAAELKRVTIEVYEPTSKRIDSSSAYKRISVFHSASVPASSNPIVRVCYKGGVHYDALLLPSSSLR